jgi:hypothetical protein
VPQAIAVGEAVERGLDAFEASGGQPGRGQPVCTLMIGRLDDWMKVLAERDGIAVNPNALDWSGIATFKRDTESSRSASSGHAAVGRLPPPAAHGPSWSAATSS